MGLLDGQLAAAFAGVFNAIYLDGNLYRMQSFAGIDPAGSYYELRGRKKGPA
jgi:hypothetical protein